MASTTACRISYHWGSPISFDSLSTPSRMCRARGSSALYTRCPKPVTGSLFLRLSLTYSAAFDASPISLAIFITSSAAPPWAGPERAATAAVTAACSVASVPVTTLAVNDDALEPCSAWSTKSLSISLAASSDGASPFSMVRKLAAWLKFISGATGSPPARIWWCAVTIIGTWLVRRMPFLSVASGDLSSASSSKAASAETAVLSTSMGWAALTVAMRSRISSGNFRAAFNSLSNSSSWLCVGNSPRSSRYDVSSNVECRARSWIE